MDSSRVITLLRRAYEEAVQRGFPVETAVSYPMPLRRDGDLVAALFATIAVPTPDRENTHIYRPGARIELAWDDARTLVVSVRDDIEPIEQQQPVGLGRTAEFAGPRYGEAEDRLLELESTFFELLDRAAHAYGAGGDDPGLRSEVLHTLQRLVTEPVRLLYEDLSPDFLRWLASGPTPSEGWTPTHDVPAEGMQAWGTPDPSTPMVAALDPGLPLQVVATAGDWAQVVASNGWTGWVDGRRLAPRR